jgi:Ca-activated chloride channel family protein
MSFAAPGFLWVTLALVLACVAFVASWLLWRANARRRFGNVGAETLAERALVLLSPGLIVIAILFAGVAAARPQFGSVDQPAERQGIDLVIVLDVSTSMQSTDARPTRLAAAQREIDELLGRMTGDRAGLVIFAGEPFARSPITSDLGALRGIVDGVDAERGLLLPGSDLGRAIRSATRLLEGDGTQTRAILIVSDGEDHGESVTEAVASARAAGIRIYTAGAGTVEGAPVLDPDPLGGPPIIRLGEDAQPVLTRLDEASLQLIARDANGRYVALRADGSLAALATDFDALAATTFEKEKTSEKLERFQSFAALALLFADLELMLLLIPRRAGARGKLAGRAALAAATTSVVFIAALCSTSVADINKEGNEAYDRGQYQASLDLYRTAQARDAAAELSYNAANALDRLGQYDAAVEEGLKARARSGEDTDQENAVEYGIGNHYVGAGNLLSAIEAYKRALLADPGDQDAKHNLELASRRLTPTPTATPPSIQLTPTPGGQEPGGQQPDTSGEETPGNPEGDAGTPGAEETPADPSQLSDEELQRRLEEALRGIEREFTPEEAQRVLDLLNEQNRRSVEDSAPAGNGGALPDY